MKSLAGLLMLALISVACPPKRLPTDWAVLEIGKSAGHKMLIAVNGDGDAWVCSLNKRSGFLHTERTVEGYACICGRLIVNPVPANMMKADGYGPIYIHLKKFGWRRTRKQVMSLGRWPLK